MSAGRITTQEKLLIIKGINPYLPGKEYAINFFDTLFLRRYGYKLKQTKVFAGQKLYTVHHPSSKKIKPSDISNINIEGPSNYVGKIIDTTDKIKTSITKTIIDEGDKVLKISKDASDLSSNIIKSNKTKYIAYGILFLSVTLGAGYFLRQVRGIIK